MSTPLRLAAFVVLLVVMVGGGALVGAAVGPIDVGGERPTHHPTSHPSP